MKSKEFYTIITSTAKQIRSDLCEAQKEYDALRIEIDNANKYTPEYIRDEIYPKMREIQSRMETMREDGNKKIRQICDDYIKQLEGEDRLNPEQIDDNEMKLLNSGITLTRKDIDAMLERCKGNQTMEQLILRYFDDHAIDPGVMYIGNRYVISSVKAVPDAVKVSLKYPSNDYAYEKLLGESSDFAGLFGGDSEE